MPKAHIAKMVGLSLTLLGGLGCGLFDSRDFQDKEDAAPEEADEEIHACLEAFGRAPCTIFDGAFIEPPELCLKFWSPTYYED